MAWLRAHVLAWATSAAVTLTVLQAFTPTAFDWILRILIIGIVFLAAKLARP